MEISQIHIGHAIESKMQELKLSKTEFGRRIGVPQQNVNRILERESIDTNKLVKISNALNFNFFGLFSDSICKVDVKTEGDNSPAVGGTHVSVGDIISNGSVDATKYLEVLLNEKDERIKEKDERIEELKERIEELKSNK